MSIQRTSQGEAQQRILPQLIFQIILPREYTSFKDSYNYAHFSQKMTPSNSF